MELGHSFSEFWGYLSPFQDDYWIITLFWGICDPGWLTSHAVPCFTALVHCSMEAWGKGSHWSPSIYRFQPSLLCSESSSGRKRCLPPPSSLLLSFSFPTGFHSCFRCLQDSTSLLLLFLTANLKEAVSLLFIPLPSSQKSPQMLVLMQTWGTWMGESTESWCVILAWSADGLTAGWDVRRWRLVWRGGSLWMWPGRYLYLCLSITLFCYICFFLDLSLPLVCHMMSCFSFGFGAKVWSETSRRLRPAFGLKPLQNVSQNKLFLL